MAKDLWRNYVPDDIRELYEVHNYRNAAQVLSTAYPDLYGELLDAFRRFRLQTAHVLRGGGNESEIPRLFGHLLRPRGWFETKVSGDLVVTTEVKEPVEGSRQKHAKKVERHTRGNFLSGHKVDFVKGDVAIDVEWNSKDQTFDRDLYAFRAFFECGVIGAGVLVTRSQELDEVFTALEIKRKYGAITTWMGKLLPRLEAGRSGGCPVLDFGITQKLIEDWHRKG